VTDCCNNETPAEPVEPNFAVVAQGPHDDLKRKQLLLKDKGFESEIVSPPGSS